MPTLTELAQKAAARKIKAAKDKKDAHNKAKNRELQERKIKQEIERQTAWLIGKTIHSLAKAGKLTPRHLANVGEILALEESPPRNWDLLADYMLPPSPARPAIISDPIADAAE